MNAQADRQALTSLINSHGFAGAGPTGNAYIAVDGTIWHEYVNLDADGDPSMWATTRVTSALQAYTYRITNDTTDLEEAF